MRTSHTFAAAVNGVLLCLTLSLSVAHAEPDSHPIVVDLLGSCHKGLVAWKKLENEPKCGYVQTPQVKIFDGTGRLRFAGSALDALQWVKSGQPSTPIPNDVVVRDLASEARLTHVSAPPSGHAWVSFYVSKPCPPCEKQLATFRSDVMPKLGVGAKLTVLELAGGE